MLSKKAMIEEIVLAYKASCISKGYKEFYGADEVLLALCFKTEQELRSICTELCINYRT